MIKYIDHPIYRVVYGIITFIGSWILLDISGVVQKLLVTFGFDAIGKVLLAFEIYIKLSISALLVLILFIIFTYVNYATNKHKQQHEVGKILKKLGMYENPNKLENLIIIGYSLTFVDPIAIHISKNNYSNTVVNIYVPDPEYIANNLKEAKSIKARLEVLSGRICEWEKLLQEKRIKELKVFYFKSVPYEYGVVINDKYFFHHYEWQWDKVDKKYELIKTPYEMRKLVEVSKRKDFYLYSFLLHRIFLLQNERSEIDLNIEVI